MCMPQALHPEHPNAGFLQVAKFDFIDEMLAWSGTQAPARILDVGCGFGGTSRHLAKKFTSATVEGAALTPPLNICQGSGIRA